MEDLGSLPSSKGPWDDELPLAKGARFLRGQAGTYLLSTWKCDLGRAYIL